MAEAQTPRPGLRQAAALLLTLGEQPAAEVLKFLTAKDVQRIGSAMSTTERCQKSRSARFLPVSSWMRWRRRPPAASGADDYIRSMLTNALGADKASGLIDRILFGRSSKGLETLKWMDPRGVADRRPPRASADDRRDPGLSRSLSRRARVLDAPARPTCAPKCWRAWRRSTACSRARSAQLDEVIERQFSGNTSSPHGQLSAAPKATAEILNHPRGSREERACFARDPPRRRAARHHDRRADLHSFHRPDRSRPAPGDSAPARRSTPTPPARDGPRPRARTRRRGCRASGRDAVVVPSRPTLIATPPVSRPRRAARHGRVGGRHLRGQAP